MKALLGAILTLAWTYCVQANPIEIQVNQPIPDGDLSGLTSSINLSGLSGPIGAVRLDLNISGTYNGDLYAYLVHDGGFSVLLNRVGRTGNNDLGYGDGGINVTFADGAANGDIHNYRSSLFGNASTALSGPLTGTWSPDGRQSSPFGVTDADARTALLSSFDGLDPNGDWTLFIADLSGGDLHQLNSWGLELNAPIAAVPESGNTALLLLMAAGCILLMGWRPWQPRLARIRKGIQVDRSQWRSRESMPRSTHPRSVKYMGV